jgi:hypothetical protein
MRFIHIKNEQECYNCKFGGIISPGEEAVAIRITGVNGFISLIFCHITCYLDWTNKTFMDRLEAWRLANPPKKFKKKPRLGRPRKYKNGLKADRIRALLYHYKKTGNTQKIQELEEQLNKTLIRSETIQQNGQTV